MSKWMSLRPLSVVVLLFSLIASVSAVQPPATNYWGYVRVDGMLPPLGTSVYVLDGNSVTVGNDTTGTSGTTLYSLSVDWEDTEVAGDQGVQAGETIHFYVAGILAHSQLVNESGSNNQLNISIADDEAPTTPTSLNASEILVESDSTVTISWTASTDNLWNNLTYTVYRKDSPGVNDGDILVATVSSTSAGTIMVNDTVPARGETYYYTVYAEDASSQISNDADETSVTVSNLVPAKVAGLSAETGNHSITLSWDAVSAHNNTFPIGADLQGYRIYWNQSGSWVIAENLIIATTFEFDDVTNDIAYFFKVAAIDLDDNEGELSDVLSATPSEKPSINFLTVEGDSFLNYEEIQSGEIINITYFSSNLEYVEYTLTNSIPAGVDADSRAALSSLEWLSVDTTGLPDDEYRLSAYANDTASQEEDVFIDFTIDNTNPAVTLPGHDDADSNVSTIQLITFTVNVTDFNTIDSVEIEELSMNPAGGDMYTLTTTLAALGITGQGLQTLTFTATDMAGNVNDSVSISLNVDNLAPIVHSPAHDDGDSIVKGTDTINITVNATDLTQVANVSISNHAFLNNGDIWWLSTTLDALGILVDGLQSLGIIAYDIVGNVNNSVSLGITLDNTAPAIASADTSDADNAVKSSDMINITVISTDAHIADIDINGSGMFQNGNTWWTMNATADFGCAGEMDCSLGFVATDVVGNINTTSLIVTVDDIAPIVQTPEVSDSIVQSTAYVNITVNVTDSKTSVSEVELNGTAMDNSGSTFYLYTTPADLSCAEGVCVLGFGATDAVGNVNSSVTTTVTVDDTAPAAYSAGYNDTTIGLNKVILIYVNATDANGIASVIASYDGAEMALAPAAEFYSASVTADDFEITSTGNYEIILAVTDNAGNINGSETITLDIDASIPAVTGASANASLARSTDQINFSVVVDDSSLISVMMNGTSMIGDLAGGVFYTVNATADFGCAGTETTCTFTITARDAVGNENSSATIEIEIDDLAPRVESAQLDDDHVKSTASVVVTVNATDPNMASVEINGKGLALQGGLYTRIDNLTSLGCAVEGPCTLTVVATDSLGHVNSSQTISAIVDDTAPVASLLYPANNSWRNGQIAKLNYSFADDLGSAANCTLTVDSQVVLSNMTANNTNTEVATSPLAPNMQHTWNISCMDEAGNTGASQTWTLGVDTLLPAVNISKNETANANGWFKSPVEVTMTAADALSGIAKIQYRNSSDGIWQNVSAGSASITLAATLDGNILYYRSVDNATNIGLTKQLGFKYDDIAPQVISVGVNSMMVPAGSTIVVRVVANDTTSGLASTASYALGAGTGTLAYSNGAYTGIVDVPDADGAYDLNITVSDLAGNSVTDSTTQITVDSSMPSIMSSKVSGSDIANATIITLTFNGIDDGWYNYTNHPEHIDVTEDSAVQLMISGTGVFVINAWANNSAAAITQNYTYTIDNTAPTIGFTTPTVNLTAVNGTVQVTAAAADTSGIASVILTMTTGSTTSTIGTDTKAPYAFSFPSSAFDDGVHTLTLTAIDNVGLSNSTSLAINITNKVQVTVGVTGDAANGGGMISYDDIKDTPAESVIDCIIGLNSTSIMIELVDADNLSVKPTTSQLSATVGSINITSDTADTSRVWILAPVEQLAALGLSAPYADVQFYANHGAGIVGPLSSGYVDNVEKEEVEYARFWFDTDDYSIFFWGKKAAAAPVSPGSSPSRATTRSITGTFTARTHEVELEAAPKTLTLNRNDAALFDAAGSQHKLTAKLITNASVDFTLDALKFSLAPGESKEFDFDGNGESDLLLKVIRVSGSTVVLELSTPVHAAIPEAEQPVIPVDEKPVPPTDTTAQPPAVTVTEEIPPKQDRSYWGVIVLAMVVIAGLGAWALYSRKQG